MSFLAYLLEFNRYRNCLGIAAIIGVAYLFSSNRSRINYRLIFKALALQFAIAIVSLKTAVGSRWLGALADGVSSMYQFADEGSRFVFGALINPTQQWGFIFAFKVLPVIIFFGGFTALLFYFGIVQRIVGVINFFMRPLLGTSGAETLCAISNSFLGQTESPLLVRDYLRGMTKSELLVVMVSGMATISGAILVVFASMGVPVKHMLASSVMAIPASIMIAKILCPETETPETMGGASVNMKSSARNAIDAVSVGTSDGMHLAINVGAMLIAFLAFLALFNTILAFGGVQLNALFAAIGLPWQLPTLSIELIFAYIFAPFSYLLGFDGTEAFSVGQLLGTKVAVNELVAYGKMVTMQFSDRTASIITYALCGFSNFSCIGIQIGGIGALVPEKRAWLAELGFIAVLGGALSNLLSAMVAGLLL